MFSWLTRKEKPVLLGPLIRRTYMDRVVPPCPTPRPCLLVGVVEPAESEILAKKGYRVVKADLVPRQADVIAMDLTCPPSEYLGQFSAVVAFDVLEHIPDDRAAMAGIHRLLETGGNAFVHVPGGDINAPLDENDKKHGHVRHGYNEPQIRAVIESQAWAETRYLKTFSPAELEAYHLALNGWGAAGRKKLAKCPFDGKEGKCHLFVLKK